MYSYYMNLNEKKKKTETKKLKKLSLYKKKMPKKDI